MNMAVMIVNMLGFYADIWSISRGDCSGIAIGVTILNVTAVLFSVWMFTVIYYLDERTHTEIAHMDFIARTTQTLLSIQNSAQNSDAKKEVKEQPRIPEPVIERPKTTNALQFIELEESK